MDFISRFSYVLLSVVLLGVMIFGVARLPDSPAMLLGLLALVAVLLALWVAARRGRTPPNPEKRLKKSLGGGRPVVVHFYSDYSLTSMLARPGLAPLEKRYKGRVEFLFMSMLDPHVRAMAERLQSHLGGTIVYNARGQEAARTAADLDRLLEQLGRGR